ncbi:hypothetical protein L1987_00738 [Smallanthus sonchifolius]|uniref:Uncharacterized protein n=1 Tax=Smallanthus sonchifolius TaxID=185202 RepID=A0ACB9K339_9ASTR|nr:hypothetical protein L1987_00738 [Smallanthus sonchifolius]
MVDGGVGYGWAMRRREFENRLLPPFTLSLRIPELITIMIMIIMTAGHHLWGKMGRYTIAMMVWHHSHEPIYSPGFFSRRAPPLVTRDFNERAFTIGIGGPVGTGKTALMLALCRFLRDKYSLAAVTNDIFTKEDGEFLVKNGALPEERIRAVETGGCPHAAIREDISINLGPLEELSNLYKADILLCESGGDNLAANFSRELADYIIYIIDVSGGDKIPRKGGPGITQADLLVINKTDLAAAVGADLAVMERDALRMRDGGPFVFAQVKHGVGVEETVHNILQAWEAATGAKRC